MSIWEKERMLHYQKIRTDPTYRLAEKLADLEAEQAPALFIPTREVSEDDLSYQIHDLQRQFNGIQKSRFTYEQFQNLQGQLRHLEKKLNEHLDPPKDNKPFKSERI